jgi:hypothetical protein
MNSVGGKYALVAKTGKTLRSDGIYLGDLRAPSLRAAALCGVGRGYDPWIFFCRYMLNTISNS